MQRRYDVDWLRMIATLAVFLFHCTRLFDTEGWHLKNSEQSHLLFVLTRGLVWPWVMELFFLISGVGTRYALNSRRAGVYLWERVRRLLVPLFTVGLFVLLPPQFYLDLVTHSGYRGGFWQVFSRYFAGFGPPRITAWPETLLPMPFSGHLWFLQYLLMISLVTLPLLLVLRSERGERWIVGLAGWCNGRGRILLFAMPLALVLIVFRGLFEAQRSWADFLWYALFFIIGYIMAADKRFTHAIKRHGWVGLVLWLAGFFGGIGSLVLVGGYDPFPGREPFSWMYVLYQICWSISSWGAVVFVLSIGAKHLGSNHRLLAYGNETVLPFYLMHQTVILVVGFYVIRWDVGILIKLLIVTVTSFSLILVLHELLIRRFNVMRFLFGMRQKERPRTHGASVDTPQPGRRPSRAPSSPAVHSGEPNADDDDPALEARIERVVNDLHMRHSVEESVPAQRWTLEERLATYRVPAVSIAVLHDGRVHWARSFGKAVAGASRMVSRNTLFQAASISKALTAFAALRVVDQGLFALDSPINRYLRSWRLPDSDAGASDAVTVERLLAHMAGVNVAGFPGYVPGSRIPTLTEILDGTGPANRSPIRIVQPPGTTWAYSGGGYLVLQQALEDVTGQDFPILMDRLVLTPAGMQNSTFCQPLPEKLACCASVGHGSDGKALPGRWHVYPELAAAGLWTTASDLARFALAVQAAASGAPQALLSPQSAAALANPQFGSFSLGLLVRRHAGHSWFTHNGGNEGYRALAYAYLTTAEGAVVMTNADAGLALASEIVNSIALEYGWPGFVPEELQFG